MLIPEYTEEVINGFTYLILADGRRLQIPSGGTPEGDEGEGDAGGDPAKEDDEDEDDNEDSDGDREASDNGDGDGTAGKQRSENIPRKRFDKINEKLKGYRELGMSPSEARNALEEWKQFKKLEKQVADEAEAKRQEATKDSKREALKDTVVDLLEEKYPGFKENQLRAKRDSDLFKDRHNADATEEIQRLARDAGLVLNDRQLGRLRGAIRDELNSNEELLESFWTPGTMKKAIKTAFSSVASDLYDPALQAADAGKLANLREKKERNVSRANAGGGPSVKTDAFASKHAVGSPEWQSDWKVWSDKQQDAIFDAHGVS